VCPRAHSYCFTTTNTIRGPPSRPTRPTGSASATQQSAPGDISERYGRRPGAKTHSNQRHMSLPAANQTGKLIFDRISAPKRLF